MIKTAIFVEGQTELIFVREMLLRVFAPTDICFQCWQLLSYEEVPADYDYPNETAAFHFNIINSASDKKVASQIIKREKKFWESGYFRIIGLRDMYSPDDYTKKVKRRKISPDLNKRTIEASQSLMTEQALRPQDIHYHFAIMEVEAWLLGLGSVFGKIDTRLSLERIKEHLGIDLYEIDPETAFIHPAMQVKQIMELAERSYRKHKEEVKALLKPTTKEDFIQLRDSGKCASFASFFASLPNESDFLGESERPE